MGILSKNTDSFGLDIGSSAIRIVQAKPGSPAGLIRQHSQEVDSKITASDAPEDLKRLADIVKSTISQSGVTSRDVVIGVPTSKVFSAILDLPKMSAQELAKAIPLSAEQYIPVPVDSVKLDWVAIGQSPADINQQEVLLVAATNNFTEKRLEMLESIGLEVIVMEPDAFALSRAFMPLEIKNEAHMILDIGANSTDLVIAIGGVPRLIRTIPVGVQNLIKVAAEGLNIDTEQARQFVLKFGMTKDKLEGQILKSIQPTIDTLISEIQKSQKFFIGRYKDIPLTKIIMTGEGSVIPEVPVYVVTTTGVAVEIGNSWLKYAYPQNLQDQLMGISPAFGVAAGLGLRGGL